MFFLFLTFAYQNYPKKLKNLNFSCSLRSQFFCPKKQLILQFSLLKKKKKKKTANGKKVVCRALRTGFGFCSVCLFVFVCFKFVVFCLFVFSWPYRYHSFACQCTHTIPASKKIIDCQARLWQKMISPWYWHRAIFKTTGINTLFWLCLF